MSHLTPSLHVACPLCAGNLDLPPQALHDVAYSRIVATKSLLKMLALTANTDFDPDEMAQAMSSVGGLADEALGLVVALYRAKAADALVG
ncbi:hypothetical protein EC912_10214 [Luteibacter rhizovicinus]|uniref:Uncharacterized protein n=1 Tax=Luteibacter rhizovicinus TaxID=242606 RepID=A0A4R3YT30_9GAMM|nr:hypothetical protein [Luteibacter rhizovicinus]TCV95671.1 hypothetical protein EC912_10214 [Luteibacter rhizovicinus]